MYYYYLSEKHGGMIINLETLEARLVFIDDVMNMINNSEDIINIEKDESGESLIKKRVRGYNYDWCRFASDIVEFFTSRNYAYVWLKGVLYRLKVYENMLCAYILNGICYIVFEDKRVLSLDTISYKLGVCDRSRIKKVLLLES